MKNNIIVLIAIILTKRLKKNKTTKIVYMYTYF